MGRFDFEQEYGKLDSTGKFVQMGRYWLHIETGKLIPIIQGGGPPSTTQNRFAFGDDDGTESGHTLDTENTDRTAQGPDTTFLVRIQVEETNGKDDIWTFQLFAQKNGAGGYTAVTTTRTDGLRLANDTQSRADNSVTTERLTAGAGSWLAGLFDDGQTQNGMGSSITLNGQYTDLEFAIEIDSGNAADTDYWDLQVYSTGSVSLDVYTQTPRVTADILEPIEITPAAAAAGADSVAPTIRYGSVSVTPAARTASGVTVIGSVSTSGPVGQVLRIDFEEGDKSDFDSEYGTTANLVAGTAAAMVGVYGLSVTLSTTDTGGLKDLSLVHDTDTIRFRFYVNYNDLSMTNGDEFEVFRITCDGTQAGLGYMSRVAIRRTDPDFIILHMATEDGGTTEVTSAGTVLPSGDVRVEVLMTRATGSGNNDGTHEIFVEGTSGGSDIDVDNYLLWATLEDALLGNESAEAGTSGTVYLDDLIIRDDATEIGAAPTMDIKYPSTDDLIQSYTDEGDASTNLYQSIDEVTISDTDYIKSALSPTSDIYRTKIETITDPSNDDYHYVNYRYRKMAAGNQINVIVRLKQSTTVIASWTHTNVGTTWVTKRQLLTTAEAAGITAYGSLYLEFESNEV